MSAISIPRTAQALVAALFMTAFAAASHAHHSFAAQYDSGKPVKVAGVVTKVEWTNPHVYLYVDATDKKTSKVTNWGFEMGPPHMLQRAGWKRNSLKIGEAVDVDGWMARDGSHSANARRVTRSSTGEVLGAASSAGQTLAGNAPAGSPPAPGPGKPAAK